MNAAEEGCFFEKGSFDGDLGGRRVRIRSGDTITGGTRD